MLKNYLTASTPACTVPDLLSFLRNHQKVPRGDARQIPGGFAVANTPPAVRPYPYRTLLNLAALAGGRHDEAEQQHVTLIVRYRRDAAAS